MALGAMFLVQQQGASGQDCSNSACFLTSSSVQGLIQLHARKKSALCCSFRARTWLPSQLMLAMGLVGLLYQNVPWAPPFVMPLVKGCTIPSQRLSVSYSPPFLLVMV